MQSYLKYEEHYECRAKAAPLKINDYCFILQPITDHQETKLPFREIRCLGPFSVEKVLPNENFIVRKLTSNKTQTFYRIRFCKYEPNTPLSEVRPERNVQPDDEIVIPLDDLYVITWETDFGELTDLSSAETPLRTITDTQEILLLLHIVRIKFSPMRTYGPPDHV